MKLTLFMIVIVFTGVWASGQADLFAKLRTLRQDGKYAAAMDLVKAQLAKTSDPQELTKLNMESGLLAGALNQPDTAEASYQKVLADDNATAALLVEMAHWELSQLAMKKNDPETARAQLQALLKESPNSRMQVLAKFALAKMDLEQKHYREARQFLTSQERRSRGEEIYPELLFQLARAERGLKNQGPYCKWVKKLYAHYPDNALVQSWDQSLEKAQMDGSPTQCHASFDDQKLRIKNLQWAGLSQKAHQEIMALKQGSKEESSEAERLEIAYLLHEGDVDQAMALLKPLYDLRKHDPNFLMQVGNAAARNGDMEAAVGAFYSSYKLSPRGKFGKQALYQAAFMSYQFQDYDGAARKFQEFMKVYPGSGLSRDARWHLAWIRYLRGDYEGASQALQQLRGQTRNSKRIANSTNLDRVDYWLGMCFYRTNHLTEAREIFERLSNDKLYGFYAMAAKSRLAKIDEYLPKAPRHQLPDENMRVSRYRAGAIMQPSDDPDWIRDVRLRQESDEKIENQAATVTSTEESENEQDLLATEQGPDRGNDIEVSDAKAEDDSTPFASPVLEKRFERARLLTTLGVEDWARWDLFEIEKRTTNREDLKNLMELYESVESFNRSSYIGQVTFSGIRSSQGMEGARSLWEHAYPRAFSNQVTKYSKEYSVPTELIWGIMRAESQYKRDVISPVGALGLMQVMPFTAQKVAGTLGEKTFDSKKLMQPDGAVKIGAKYLQRLMKKFEGNPALVAAAYNAGPHRVKAWLAGFGELDLDEFIEHIPYLETRNYVKKVLTNFGTYARLYAAANKENSSLALAEAVHVKVNEPIVAKETWDEL